jgi:glycosyltransferase involved in cell wall biosynthesis
MITYNHERFVTRAIEGVLMQRCNFSYELVIGEDNSTDSTRELCERYFRDHSETINLLPSGGNLGMMPNFIRSLNACQGKYIALCEGDDYWTDPHKLQKQVDFLDQNSGYSFCFHNAEVLIEDKEIKFSEPFTSIPNNPVTFRDVVTGNFIPTASVVFRNNIGFLPEWFRHVSSGDRALFGLLALRGNGYYMPEKMAVYRKHLAGVSEVPSHSFDVKINNSQRKLILYEGLNKISVRRYSAVLSPIIAGFYWGIMINGFRAGRILTGVKGLIMIFRYDFRLILRKIHKVYSRAFIL